MPWPLGRRGEERRGGGGLPLLTSPKKRKVGWGFEGPLPLSSLTHVFSGIPGPVCLQRACPKACPCRCAALLACLVGLFAETNDTGGHRGVALARASTHTMSVC